MISPPDMRTAPGGSTQAPFPDGVASTPPVSSPASSQTTSPEATTRTPPWPIVYLEEVNHGVIAVVPAAPGVAAWWHGASLPVIAWIYDALGLTYASVLCETGPFVIEGDRAGLTFTWPDPE